MTGTVVRVEPPLGRLLAQAEAALGADVPADVADGPLRVGVDLGTATCVLTVIDANGSPVWVDRLDTGAVRDGVVVDFAAAVESVRILRERAEVLLGTALTSAATAYPPRVGEAESRACRYVLEAAGFDMVHLTDEVSAANAVLGVRDGVVVDVGGGSTGVGVFRAGRLEFLDDRPGGGHHLDLILAGALGVDLADARRLKQTSGGAHAAILRPGFERIAQNVAELTDDATDLEVHLAGGALMYPGADAVVSAHLSRVVHAYPFAELITPLGIATVASPGQEQG